MSLDVLIEDPRWEAVNLPDLVHQVEAALECQIGLVAETTEGSLLACDDARIAVLNADFRGKPTATNVLGWPAAERGADQPGAVPPLPEPDATGVVELGDIAISWDTCARESQAAGLPMADHLRHLILHGILHLLGYDHIRDPDATLMEELETQVLGTLGVKDPYR